MWLETAGLATFMEDMDNGGYLLRELDAQLRRKESLPPTELLRVTVDLIGQVVDVYLKDGSVCNGILYDLTGHRVTLKQARMTKKGNVDSTIGKEPVVTLGLPSYDLVKIVAKGVTLTLDGVVWKKTPNNEEPVKPVVCSSNRVQKNEQEEILPWRPWMKKIEHEEQPPQCSRMQKNEQEEQPAPHSRVQQIEQEEQMIEQEEQLPPLSGEQMNMVPYSSSTSSLGNRFTPSGQYQHDSQYRGQEQQGFLYSGQGQENYLHNGQGQQDFPYSGQGPQNYLYSGQGQQGFPYRGQGLQNYPYNSQMQPSYPYNDQGQPGFPNSDQGLQTIPYNTFLGTQQHHPHDSNPPVLPLHHASATQIAPHNLEIGSQNPHHLGSSPSDYPPMFPRYYRPPGPPSVSKILSSTRPRY